MIISLYHFFQKRRKKSVSFSESTVTPSDVLFCAMKCSKLKNTEFKVMENREKAADSTFYKLDRENFCLLLLEIAAD